MDVIRSVLIIYVSFCLRLMSVATFELADLLVRRSSLELLVSLLDWLSTVGFSHTFNNQHVLSTNGRRTGGNNDCISLHDEKQIGSFYLVHPSMLLVTQ